MPIFEIFFHFSSFFEKFCSFFSIFPNLFLKIFSIFPEFTKKILIFINFYLIFLKIHFFCRFFFAVVF